MRNFESFETIQEADEYARSQMELLKNSPDFGRLSDETINAFNGMIHASASVIRLCIAEVRKYEFLLEQNSK